MKKIESETEILDQFLDLQEKTVVDVGCGTGGLARLMAPQCKLVIGIDSKEMIAKAKKEKDIPENVQFQEATAQDLPLSNELADILIYFASFHHIPEDLFPEAMEECHRVLKKGGAALFVEPVPRPGSYYEITRLSEDEADLQRGAEKIIKNVYQWNLRETDEGFFYMERSFKDFEALLGWYLDDAIEREKQINQAREHIEKNLLTPPDTLDTIRFKSIIRVNKLIKK